MPVLQLELILVALRVALDGALRDKGAGGGWSLRRLGTRGARCETTRKDADDFPQPAGRGGAQGRSRAAAARGVHGASSATGAAPTCSAKRSSTAVMMQA